MQAAQSSARFSALPDSGKLLLYIALKSGLWDRIHGELVKPARLAVEKYPPIKTFCAGAGCRKTFEADVANELRQRAGIPEKGMGIFFQSLESGARALLT